MLFKRVYDDNDPVERYSYFLIDCYNVSNRARFRFDVSDNLYRRDT